MRVPAVLLFCLVAAGVTTSSAQDYYPLDYTVEAGDITINDYETGIYDIDTIHNGRSFSVDLGLIWNDAENVTNSTNIIYWEMFVDNKFQWNGTEQIDDSRNLPTTLSAGNATVYNSGTHTVQVKIRLDETEGESSRNYQSFNKGLSWMPLIVVLIFAVTTHMVELSLGLGVFVGACMVSGTIVDGFKTTLDTYILEALADVDHGYVYLFALFMSGMVGLLEKSGGLLGITEALKRFVKSPRSAQIAGFCCGLIIFFDDYANTLVAGSSMRPLMDAFCVSREKLAFIVDATAAPIASIVPISSWVGFEVGLIQTELDKILEKYPDADVAQTGFAVFLETIKYRYYAIFMLFLMPLLIVSGRDMGPMLIAERRVRVYGRTDGGPGATLAADGGKLTSTNAADPDTPCRWWNMALPILMLVFYIFWLLVVTGIDDSNPNQDFLDIMQNSDSYSALLWGTMAGALTSFAFYLFQDKKDGKIIWFNIKGRVMSWIPRRWRKKQSDEEAKDEARPLMTVREAMASFLAGMEHIFGALVVLTLAWASGAIMVAVGLDRLFGELIVESNLDYRFLPTISFVVSMVIAFATGTSWGTMTIMFPLLLVPTWEASGGNDVVFYATTAGILAGAVAGDHASPISDTTVLSSLASECQLLEHVRTQAPYVLVVSLWSIVVGTIPAGMEAFHNGVSIALGFITMLLHTLFTSVFAINKSGRYDCFTELYLIMTKSEDLQFLKEEVARSYEAGGPLELPVETDEDNEKLGQSIGESKTIGETGITKSVGFENEEALANNKKLEEDDEESDSSSNKNGDGEQEKALGQSVFKDGGEAEGDASEKEETTEDKAEEQTGSFKEE